MKYEIFTKECQWLGEPKGGLIAVVDGRRFEQHLIEFCNSEHLTPTGAVSVIVWGANLLVTQMCFKPGN